MGDDLLVELAGEEIVALGKVSQRKHRDRRDGSTRIQTRQPRGSVGRGLDPGPPGLRVTSVPTPRRRAPLEPQRAHAHGHRRHDQQRQPRCQRDSRLAFPRLREPVRGQVVDPRERQNDRQAQECQHDHGLQHPVRSVERRKHDLAELQRHERGSHVHAARAHDAPPPQFPPEGAQALSSLHRSIASPVPLMGPLNAWFR